MTFAESASINALHVYGGFGNKKTIDITGKQLLAC